MADLETLLDRNRSFSERFDAGDLPIRPRLATIILTCLDSRVDPGHFFGLELGDSFVIRNAGGRISPAVIQDLTILAALGASMPGSSARQPQLVLIRHTDCGMARLAGPPLQQQMAERLGLSDEEVAALAVTDPAKTVRDDIQQLRELPGTPDALIVSGHVYDVHTGTIEQVVPPAPLRAAT